MFSTKRGACLIAAGITIAGATHLARPAHAQGQAACTATQAAYAQGYADGFCGGAGGTVDSCQDNGNGGFSFTWVCEPY